MDKTTNNKSLIISVMRAVAVLSIVSAHVDAVIDDYSSRLLRNFATGGVAVFFVISGYLFFYNKRGIIDFFKRKFSTIFIPWLFTGTITFLYTEIRHLGIGGLSIISYLKWIFGIKTYLWYMTVLVALYILFLLFAKYRAFLIVMPIIAIISFATNKFTYPFLYQWGGNYLNVFNWSLFFEAGYIINKFDIITKINKYLKLKIFISFILLYFVVLFLLSFSHQLSYNIPLYLPYCVLYIIAVFSFAQLFKNSSFILKIGEHSFSIYLLHMPIAGIISAVGKILNIWIFTILSPFIAIIIVELFIYIFEKIIDLLKLNKSKFNLLIGLR